MKHASPVPVRAFSLVRRFTWLVVGGSVVTLLLHTALLVVFLKPLGDELIARVSSELRVVDAVLRMTPASQRQAIATAISDESLTLTRSAPPPAAKDKSRKESMPPPLMDQLNATMGRTVSYVAYTDASGRAQLSLSIPTDDGPWWLTVHSVRPSAGWMLLPILTGVALVALAAILALVVGVRLITRPMSQLAHDMLLRRNQLRQIDEPADVSIELQGVIRSFNSLVSAVELSAQSGRELLAGLSHDLRTPLARLRLRAETECSDALWQRMERDFMAVGRIIDQFLAYVQGQSGVAVGALHPLGDLVEEVVTQYRAEGAPVVLLPSDRDGPMVPDMGMQRALMNLIDNALIYGRAPVQVEFKTKGDEAWVTVFDHGHGIAEADLHRAFQPFVRLSAAGADNGNCGLGLAIVAQVAQQLGGRTVLLSFDGQRSGLAILLPC